MNIRKQTILEALQFDRFSLHKVGSNLKQMIAEAEDLIASNAWNRSELTIVHKQIALYYLFYLRDQSKALHFLRKCEITSSLELAQLQNLIAHAYTIDGGYKDDSFFKKALNLYISIGKLADPYRERDRQLWMGFAYRYISCMHHRQGNASESQAYIEKAIKIQKKYVQSTPFVKLDLAESLHIYGVILLKQNRLKEAEEKLLAAFEYEKQFCEETGADHFLKFITMQSLGSLWARMGDTEKALHILHEAYQGQVKYYQTEIHADIAKTWHFIGDALMKDKKYSEALTAYQKALTIKETLHLREMAKVTEDAMQRAQLAQKNQDFSFDWNNDKTFAPNQGKAADLEQFLSDYKPSSNPQDDAVHLGQLCYKLGTFYNHIKRDANLALPKLKIAEQKLSGDELAWTQNHLAYTYQQKMFKEKNEADIKTYQALADSYFDKVYNTYKDSNQPDQVKILAFAYCVKALVANIVNNNDDDLKYYKTALDLYEKVGELDDQYARVANQYGRILMEKGRMAESQSYFERVKNYWADRENANESSYYLRHLKFNADFLRLNYLPMSLLEYKKAHRISEKIEGKDSPYTKEVKTTIQEVQDQLSLEKKGTCTAILFRPSFAAKEVTEQQQPRVRMATTRP